MSRQHITIALIVSLGLNVFLFVSLIEQERSDDSDTLPGENEMQEEEYIAYPNASLLPERGDYPLLHIIDGDTIIIASAGRSESVRLIGIDTPEPHDPGGPECYATEATMHLQELANTGLITLVFDDSQGRRDIYGRLLAYVELPDGTDLGEMMLRDGYALEYTYNTPYVRTNTYQAAQAEAIEGEKGLWASTTCK